MIVALSSSKSLPQLSVLENGYHPCVYITLSYTLVCWSRISKNENNEKRSRAVLVLPGPSDILQCAAAVAGRSEPSIFINHSVLLLCHPHTNTRKARTRIHTHTLASVPPFLLQCSRIPTVYVTMCTRTRASCIFETFFRKIWDLNQSPHNYVWEGMLWESSVTFFLYSFNISRVLCTVVDWCVTTVKLRLCRFPHSRLSMLCKPITSYLRCTWSDVH